MGFGVLFIGYFISTVAAFAFPDIAGFSGYAIMVIALMSLAEYDSKFGFALIPAIPVVLIHLILTVGVFADYFVFPEPGFVGVVARYSDYILGALKFVFHFVLCYAVKSIAEDTGAVKLCFPAVRNIFIYGACYSVDLASSFFTTGAGYLVPIAAIGYILSIILNHIMIFSAYMNICDENDVDMEIKKTNIKWYDKLVEKKAAQEQKAADETKAYFQARYERKMRERAERVAKKNNKKK